MASDTVEGQLQDIREQLDVQAEAISKLAAVVSTLEGVDAAALSPYVLHLTKLRGPAVQVRPNRNPLWSHQSRVVGLLPKAGREGFEPSREFHTPYPLSRRVLST